MIHPYGYLFTWLDRFLMLSTNRFYEQQYQGNQYATGGEGRRETAALEVFVEDYGLKDKRVLEMRRVIDKIENYIL